MFDATHPDTHDVFARTLWAEARNQGQVGMEAVAAVILNRASHPRWWGKDILGVCLAPMQFSCWNADDPQRASIRSVDASNALFKTCLDIAGRGMAGSLGDATNGADSYVNLAVASPSWAKDRTPCARIGDHTFYRLELAPPAPKLAPAPAPAAAPAAPAARAAAKPGLLAAVFGFLSSFMPRRA